MYIIYACIEIKILAGSVLKSEEFVTECSTTKRFDHPNVLSIIGVASPPEETIPMMVLPFMLHGDVKSFLKSKRGERIKVDEYPMVLLIYKFTHVTVFIQYAYLDNN